MASIVLIFWPYLVTLWHLKIFRQYSSFSSFRSLDLGWRASQLYPKKSIRSIKTPYIGLWWDLLLRLWRLLLFRCFCNLLDWALFPFSLLRHGLIAWTASSSHRRSKLLSNPALMLLLSWRRFRTRGSKPFRFLVLPVQIRNQALFDHLVHLCSLHDEFDILGGWLLQSLLVFTRPLTLFFPCCIASWIIACLISLSGVSAVYFSCSLFFCFLARFPNLGTCGFIFLW